MESTRGVGAPQPILVKLQRSRAHLLWALGAAVLFVLWVALWRVGYGDLNSSLAVAPLPFVVAHVLFAGCIAFCVLTALSKHWTSKRTPFVTGTFLFPSGVIVARLKDLDITPIDELSDVRTEGAAVTVVSAGKSFTFLAADSAQAEQVRAVVKGSREKYLQAKSAGDIRQLLLLDPLQDSGVPNPLAPTEPWAPPLLLGRWASLAAVCAVGLLLGWAVFWVRNTWSARALYAAAVAEDNSQAYRAYLERGGKRPEVDAILLPRAELRDAQAKGSVEAIEQYIKEHPQTRIAPEITAAHRSALLSALEKAKKAGTLSALDQLEKKHKGYPLIQNELIAARQEIYTRALTNFKANAAPTPELLPFVQRLVHYSQLHGPKVEIRLRQNYTQNYGHIEDIVSKSPYYTGAPLLPGQYFKGKYVEAREARLYEQLQQRLGQAFPKDVLAFELGADLPEEGDLPQVKVPTLFVEHSVTFSGGFVGLKRQGMYMGMTLAFRAAFRIPGQKGDQLLYRIKLWRAPKQELIDGVKTAEELYETLARDGYDTFSREYLEYWFKKP